MWWIIMYIYIGLSTGTLLGLSIAKDEFDDVKSNKKTIALILLILFASVILPPVLSFCSIMDLRKYLIKKRFEKQSIKESKAREEELKLQKQLDKENKRRNDLAKGDNSLNINDHKKEISKMILRTNDLEDMASLLNHDKMMKEALIKLKETKPSLSNSVKWIMEQYGVH